MYQPPVGVMPADFLRASSFVFVPELSPRETKVEPDAAIFLKASTAEVMPLILAESAAGPTIQK
jgi:hypothetical protein